MESVFKNYGLLGYPLEHSLSPNMHNRAFRELGIPGVYELFETEPAGLPDFLNSLDPKRIYGFNVTIPYKQTILEYVTFGKESSAARDIGAVNTVIRAGGVLKGFNTDYIGFGRHLEELKFSPRYKRVALLGAGGAARAVTYSLIKSEAMSIDVFDIDTAKADGLIEMAARVNGNFSIRKAESIEDLGIITKDLLINATPVGLKEQDRCLVREEMLREGQFVYDLIYNPPETRLLELARKRGSQVSNGLGMLIYQGAQAFKYFTATEVSIKEIAGIMKKALTEG